MAERVGFEPTKPFGLPVFKTGAINHSAISPFSSLQPIEGEELVELVTLSRTLTPNVVEPP
jgi:hypothetical protein